MIERISEISRIKSFVFHNESNTSLMSIARKKYYYAKYISRYASKNRRSLNIMVADRYKLFLSRPDVLFRDPIKGLGLLFMKSFEFGAGAVGYIMGTIEK
jgi:hypothetical protein